MPPLVLVGTGAWRRVGAETRRLGGKRALIVSGQAMIRAGFMAEMQTLLEAEGLESVLFDKVTEEPTTEHVEEGLRLLRDEGCDLVIGFGGGSPIDAGKAIAVMATNPGRISDYMGAGKVKAPKLPFIAVNTTAGTGSEVTGNTVITDTATDVKMLITNPLIIPDVAIDDPTLTLSCPPEVTASSGMDALTHAIEAYVSRRANPISDVLALSAIRRIAGNLRRAWGHGDDIEARSEMTLAALEAGMAFSNSSVALVHGMARPIGAYFHLPHGLSNAMLLPYVMEFSAEGAPQRFADIAVAMGEGIEGLSIAGAARQAADAVMALKDDLRIPSLSGAGIDAARLLELTPKMAQDAIASGSPANNLRIASAEEIAELYKKAL